MPQQATDSVMGEDGHVYHYPYEPLAAVMIHVAINTHG
jgi:hypothetical protein